MKSHFGPFCAAIASLMFSSNLYAVEYIGTPKVVLDQEGLMKRPECKIALKSDGKVNWVEMTFADQVVPFYFPAGWINADEGSIDKNRIPMELSIDGGSAQIIGENPTTLYNMEVSTEPSFNKMTIHMNRDYFILNDLESRNLQEIVAHLEANKSKMYNDSSYQGIQNILDGLEMNIVSPQDFSRNAIPKSFRYTYREVLNGSAQKGLTGENAVLAVHNQFDVECQDLKPLK